MSQTLCHYPSMVSKDTEAPPWLPWKLFKSEGAKIRVRVQGKRRQVKTPCPFMNAYLVESVMKRTDVRLKPMFPLQERSEGRKPVRSQVRTHTRCRSIVYPTIYEKKRTLDVRRSYDGRRARSELGHLSGLRGRKGEDPYGCADVCKWSIDGESPRSVGLSRMDSGLIQ